MQAIIAGYCQHVKRKVGYSQRLLGGQTETSRLLDESTSLQGGQIFSLCCWIKPTRVWPMSTTDSLLEEIADFLRRHEMSQSRFGELALNDRGFMTRLLSGERSPTARTIDRLRTFMSKHSQTKHAA